MLHSRCAKLRTLNSGRKLSPVLGGLNNGELSCVAVVLGQASNPADDQDCRNDGGQHRDGTG